MIGVVFVCLGNICRSPLAEGIFKDIVRKDGTSGLFHIDSAGTSNYHINEEPHELSRRVAEKNNIKLEHLGRQFSAYDFEQFDYIIPLDANNKADIENLINDKYSYDSEVRLLRDFDNANSSEDVMDPYGYPESVFDEVYQIMHESCSNLYEYIKEKHGIS